MRLRSGFISRHDGDIDGRLMPQEVHIFHFSRVGRLIAVGHAIAFLKKAAEYSFLVLCRR